MTRQAGLPRLRAARARPGRRADARGGAAQGRTGYPVGTPTLATARSFAVALKPTAVPPALRFVNSDETFRFDWRPGVTYLMGGVETQVVNTRGRARPGGSVRGEGLTRARRVDPRRDVPVWGRHGARPPPPSY
jgi:hypothetical protein